MQMLKAYMQENPWLANVAAVALVSFLGAGQLLITLGLAASFIPIAPTDFVQRIFPIYLPEVRPEYEMPLYRFFVMAALTLQALLLWRLRERLEERGWHKKLGFLIMVLAFWLGVQLFAVFKLWVLGDIGWARGILYCGLASSLLSLIFLPELRRLVALFKEFLSREKLPWWFTLGSQVALLVFILKVVFLPDIPALMSRVLSYDKFYHLDSFLMAPGLAYQQGLVLNKDITSEYSVVIPIVFNQLSRWLGGFDYAQVIGLLIFLVALYYLFFYLFIRRITASRAWAVLASFLAIKLQLFHAGIFPLYWIYPSATALRFFWDIFFLYALWLYTQGKGQRYLVLMAMITGIALSWTMDVGVYMYVSLTAVLCYGIYRAPRQIWAQLSIFLLAPITACLILFLFQGKYLFSAAFWHRHIEFAGLFMQGWGALPIDSALMQKQFFAVCLGVFLIVFYAVNTTWHLIQLLATRQKEHLFFTVVGIYGLGLYHYYIHRSAVSSYEVVVIPAIILGIYGLMRLTNSWALWQRRALAIALFAWCLTALLTGFVFLFYPHGWRMTGHNWEQEKAFARKAFDFSKDAQLISERTSLDQGVALISSFETKILMQAKRKPFFYYFPLMESSLMHEEGVRHTYLHTYDRLEETLGQLKRQRPRYIFIERRLWEGPLAQVIRQKEKGLDALIAFIKGRYEVESQGQWLLALKENEGK